MDENQAQPSRKESAQEILLRAGRTIFVWGAAAALAVLAWVDALPAAWAAFSLGVLHALLALTLEYGLRQTSLPPGWRYRLAFFTSAILPVLQGISIWLSLSLLPASSDVSLLAGSVSLFLARQAAAVAGAFAGSLLATALDCGLWENNSPPSQAALEEVYHLHVEQIGQPGPTAPGKRGFDLVLALVGLLISAPIWGLSIFLIWLEDPGPLFFVKNSVGKGGVNFRQFKLRTMVRGAEEHTGPVLAQLGDQRVLRVGRLLRKTALDELPQLVNILAGQMSFVGPRPQRTVLVREYLQKMPEYAWRHQVLPGIAGLAQVAGDYYLTPRQKLRFDRLYIRYSGLGFDLKLILLACLITFWLRWQKDWDGRAPHALIRYQPSRLARPAAPNPARPTSE